MARPDPPDAGAPRDLTDRRFWLTAAAFALCYGLLCSHFLPLSYVFGPGPIQGDDFDTHYAQTLRVLEGLDGWGQPWVYDVRLLAGQPEGTIFDADNKGWEIWTFVLWKLGLRKALAFNLYVLCAMLASPLVVYWSSRLFGFAPWPSLVASGLAGLMWLFDSFCHWVWFVGMAAYGSAAYFALLPLSLFYRFVEDERPGLGVASAVLLALSLLNHPYTFFILVVPMGLIYLRALRRLTRRTHALVVGVVMFAIGFNAFWLLPAIAHWHYIQDSGMYAQGGLQYLVWDFFEVLRRPEDTGMIGVRTAIRVLVYAAALPGLFLLRERRDRRFWPLAAALGTMLVLAYLGPIIPGAEQIQPYRHVLPAGFLATLGVAALAEWLARERAFAKLHRGVKIVLAVLAVGVVQHVGVNALYYAPKLLPESADLPSGLPSILMKYGFLRIPSGESHLDYRHPRDPVIEVGADEVIDWVNANIPAGSRVLVDNIVLGERLAWKGQVEVIGGFTERNIAHSWANLFREHGLALVPHDELANYLRSWAIDWVIVQTERPDFAQATDLLEPLPRVANRLIYRTRRPASRVLVGSGEVTASTNRIEIENSDPSRIVVLSYHWHESLRCTPDCRVERVLVGLDTVGLIRVPLPHPENFTIYNSYELW